MSYTAHSWIFIITSLQSAILSFHIEKHLLNIVRTKSYLKSSYHVYFKVPPLLQTSSLYGYMKKNAVYLG